MSHTSTHLKIWTDGGSRGNPGPAAIGIVIKDQDDTLIKQHHHYLGQPITNNQAEYQALHQALILATDLQATTINCFLDSQLVVEQINGRYKVKDPGLQQWWQKIQDQLKHFASFKVEYVPRVQNAQADALVNQALDQAAL